MFETVFSAVLSNPLSMLRRQMPICRFPHRDFTDLFGEDSTWYILLSAPGVQMAAKSESIAFTYSATNEELSNWADRQLPVVRSAMFMEVVWTFQQNDGANCHLTFRPDKYNITFGCDQNFTQLSPIVRYFRGGINFYGEPSGLRVGARGWEFNASYFFVPRARGRKVRADISMQPFTYDSHIDIQQFGRASATCAPIGIFGETWDGGNSAFYHRHVHEHENATYSYWHAHGGGDNHSHHDHSHDDLPSVFLKPWEELSDEERSAAVSLGYDEYTWPGHSHGRRLHEDEDKHADEPDYPGYLDLRNYTNEEEIEVRGEAELALTMPLRNYRVADPYNVTEWKYSRFFKSSFATCLPRLGMSRPHTDFYHRHASQHTLPWSVGIY